jgi:putative PIN family toxin of toxin-antitoxin system
VKIVLDTNILLQSIGHESRLLPIWNAFLEGTFYLYLTTAILLEYEELLIQKTSKQAAAFVVSLIGNAPNVHFIAIYYEWNSITADPDDNKFFDAAVAANADYLVSNDSHFNMVKNLAFPKVNIISSDGFLQLLSGMP